MTDTTDPTTDPTPDPTPDVPVSPDVTGQLVTGTTETWSVLNISIKARDYTTLKTELDNIVSKLSNFDGSTPASYNDILDDDGTSLLDYSITT